MVQLILMKFFFLHLFGTSFAQNVTEPEERIVGGREVDPPHKYPFHVYFAANNYACAGSIIDKRHVLTAAHCLFNADGEMHNAKDCAIVAGAHIRPGSGWECSESGTEDSWQIIGVEAFIQRDDYDTLTHENDIAILRLVEDIIFNDIVAPVNLPDELITDETEIATIIGWGTTDPWDPNEQSVTDHNTNVLSCFLQEAQVDVTVPSFQGYELGGFCEAILYGMFENKICAGREGVDSCQGDSGGPLVVQTSEKSFTQIGIVSYGYGCATDFPGIYTRLDRYTRWISFVTRTRDLN